MNPNGPNVILDLLASFASVDMRDVFVKAADEIRALRERILAVEADRYRLNKQSMDMCLEIDNLERDLLRTNIELNRLRLKDRMSNTAPAPSSPGFLALTTEDWQNMIKLVHPDKHGNSELATKITKLVIAARPPR